MQDEWQFCLGLHLHPGGRPLFIPGCRCGIDWARSHKFALEPCGGGWDGFRFAMRCGWRHRSIVVVWFVFFFCWFSSAVAESFWHGRGVRVLMKEPRFNTGPHQTIHSANWAQIDQSTCLPMQDLLHDSWDLLLSGGQQEFDPVSTERDRHWQPEDRPILDVWQSAPGDLWCSGRVLLLLRFDGRALLHLLGEEPKRGRVAMASRQRCRAWLQQRHESALGEPLRAGKRWHSGPQHASQWQLLWHEPRNGRKQQTPNSNGQDACAQSLLPHLTLRRVIWCLRCRRSGLGKRMATLEYRNS